MRNIYNFSAGPAVLPEPVLQEAADEMMDYKGSGMSVMEISHRSALFQSIIEETEYDLRTLMNIPDDYEVLFLQGGTSLQFAMIPMNFMRNKKADYILTGYWAKKAYEGQHIIFRYAAVIPLGRRKEMQFRAFPELLFDLAGRKSFIRNYDDFSDIVVTDESRVGACVNAVAGKHFRTDWLHKLNVIGIQDGHIAAALDPCFI